MPSTTYTLNRSIPAEPGYDLVAFGPVAHGERMLVGGFMKELLETMWTQKAFGPHVVQEFLNSQLNRWVPFNPGVAGRVDEGLGRHVAQPFDADAAAPATVNLLSQMALARPSTAP